MEFEITSDQFWDNQELISLYDNVLGNYWALLDEPAQQVTKQLGMEFIHCDFSEIVNHVSKNTIYKFKVVNKQKFLWARIKYGY